MAPPPPSAPVPVLPADLVEALRADLGSAGYTVDQVTELLGGVAAGALMRDHLAPARRVLDRVGPSPLATVLRLFALGDAVSPEALDAAFPQVGGSGLLRIGVVGEVEVASGDRRGAQCRAMCDLRPYGDETHTWWVASDLGEVVTGRPLNPDHVLGVGGASLTLARWAPRTPVDRLLDLGTGCGVQALHAGTHATHVVATDVSERALAFARFNAALAGQTWDLRAGDLFEPVRAGAPELFDLVISNPPFVISPRMAGLPVYEYRDGGRDGDELVESFVRGVGAHLAPDGVACFLADWEVAGDDWRDRWRGWLEVPECAGLDAWVIAREHQDLAEYAETWARDGGHRPGSEEYDRWIAAWLTDFESRDVDSIWFGIVVLHRPADDRARWVEFDEVTGPIDAAMGPHVAQGLAARSRLHTTTDEALFATRWAVAPDVTEERHSRPGAADPNVIMIRQGGGFRRAVQADTALSAFVSVCDGELTGDVAVTAIAALTDEDPVALRGRLSTPLRRLIADGLLVPAEAQPGADSR